MGKLDISDRYTGKCSHQRKFSMCSSHRFIVTKRYVISIIYICVVIAVLGFTYFTVWTPDMNLWCNFDKSNSKAKTVDSFLLMQDRERKAYDRLMHYILHPQAHCITSKAIGGKMGHNKKRDGDKVICLEPGPGISDDCIVYSFGIANEWSFDESMRRLFKCKIYSFDPSLGVEDHVHSEGIWFYNVGIGEFDGKIKVGDQIWNIKTFGSILQQLGHQNKTIDVLKIDIEGAEYAAMEDIFKNGLLNHVNHLCMEIHIPDNPYWTRLLKFLKRIEETGLRHFSTKNNTQTPLLRVPGFYSRYEQQFFEMAWYRH